MPAGNVTLRKVVPPLVDSTMTEDSCVPRSREPANKDMPPSSRALLRFPWSLRCSRSRPRRSISRAGRRCRYRPRGSAVRLVVGDGDVVVAAGVVDLRPRSSVVARLPRAPSATRNVKVTGVLRIGHHVSETVVPVVAWGRHVYPDACGIRNLPACRRRCPKHPHHRLHPLCHCCCRPSNPPPPDPPEAEAPPNPDEPPDAEAPPIPRRLRYLVIRHRLPRNPLVDLLRCCSQPTSHRRS